MKKLFALILFLPLIIVAQHANFDRLFVGGAAESTPPEPEAPCDVQVYSWPNNGNGIPLGRYAEGLYLASRIDATNSASVCAAEVNVSNTGTPSGTAACAIYTANGTTIGTLLSDWSDELTMPVTGLQTFTNFSATVVSGTAYYVVLRLTASADVDNYVGLMANDAGNILNGIMYSANGSSFVGVGLDQYRMQVRLLSQ